MSNEITQVTESIVLHNQNIPLTSLQRCGLANSTTASTHGACLQYWDSCGKLCWWHWQCCHWWWGGYWWCWWGRQSRYGGGQFPPNPGQRQQDLALTKQSRPLRQTGAESADAFSYFQPLLVPILGRHSLLWTHPALLPSSSTVLFSRYFADHASMEPFTHNYEPECNVWRHIGMKGVPSKRMRRHFLEAMRVE